MPLMNNTMLSMSEKTGVSFSLFFLFTIYLAMKKHTFVQVRTLTIHNVKPGDAGASLFLL
jgi:hypothetical protein